MPQSLKTRVGFFDLADQAIYKIDEIMLCALRARIRAGSRPARG